MLVGLGLVAVVRRPRNPTGLEAVRGHRVFGVGRKEAVVEIAVTLAAGGFVARPRAGGWEIDGREADPGTADALRDLTETLVRLRAVDVFRPREAAAYGLDRPRATITLRTARATRRLVLGELNAAASAVYARREDDPRVMQVGTLLLSQLERVFYHRDRARDGQVPDSG